MEIRTAQRRWWLTAPAVALASGMALIVVINFWCQLHGTVTGGMPVAFGVSVPWALKAALGWILVGGSLGLYGAKLLGSPFAEQHRWATRAALLAGAVVVTLSCESLLIRGDNPLLLWLYDRLPLHLMFASLLLAGHLRLASSRARHTSQADTSVAPPDVVEVMTGTGRTEVRIADIECLEAERNYINVHTPQRSYLLRQTLSSLEKSLGARDFLRVHRSTIVNRAKIRERRQGGVLVLSSGRVVRVSRAFAQDVNRSAN